MTYISLELIFSGLTPDGRENLCSNCLDTKDFPVEVLLSCLADTISTSPSVLICRSWGHDNLEWDMNLISDVALKLSRIPQTYLRRVFRHIELDCELIRVIVELGPGWQVTWWWHWRCCDTLGLEDGAASERLHSDLERSVSGEIYCGSKHSWQLHLGAKNIITSQLISTKKTHAPRLDG